MSDAQGKAKPHIEVDLKSLRVGQLLDRPLFVFLPENKRYVCLAKESLPLEERIFNKLKKFNSVFSDRHPLAAKFPQLEEIPAQLGEIFRRDSLSNFEKSKVVAERTRWAMPIVLQGLQDAEHQSMIIHFVYKIVESPSPVALSLFADQSLEAFRRGLLRSMTAAMLAMWLGYTDLEFLRDWVRAVFAYESAVVNERHVLDIADEPSDAELKRMLAESDSKTVPELQIDRVALRCLFQQKRLMAVWGEELTEVIWLVRRLENAISPEQCRVFQKLRQIVDRMGVTIAQPRQEGIAA